MRPPPTEEARLEVLFDALVWKPSRPEYAAEVGPHEYVVRGRTITEEDWIVVIDAIKRYGVRERYIATGNLYRYLLVGQTPLLGPFESSRTAR